MVRTGPVRPLQTVSIVAYTRVGAYAIACLLPVALAIVIARMALPVPFMDEWEWARLIYAAHLGNLQFPALWAQHNEHRMLFPNLIMLGLAALGGWNQLRETLFSLLLVVMTQGGVFVLLRRVIDAAKLPYVFLVVSLLLYTLAQMENWDWGFQTAWFLCNCCVVWAMVFLGTSGQSWFALIAAAMCAIVASFSSSQGLVVWVAGVVSLLLTAKRRPMQIVAWVACAVAVLALYLHGFVRPAGHPDPLLVLHDPKTIFRYFGAYFGAVFAGWLKFALAVTIGWFGLLALFGLSAQVVVTYRRDRVRAAKAAGFVGLGAYAVFVGVITTFGRAGFGELQAEASRYTSIAIYCWIAVAALSVAYEQEIRQRLPARAFTLWPVVAVAFAGLYVGANLAGLALGKGRIASVESAYPALIAGHGPELTAVYPAEAPVEELLRDLRSIKDGPYYE